MDHGYISTSPTLELPQKCVSSLLRTVKLQWFPTCPVSQDFFFARFPHFETSLSEFITRPGNAKLFATFLVCFFVGRLGLGSGFSGKPLIPNWNATPAGTVAYLIFQGGNKAGSIVFFF